MTLTSGTLDTHPLPLPAPPSTITPPTFLPSPLPHYPHSPRKTTWSVKMLTLLPGRRSFSSRGKTHYTMPVPARPSPCFFVLSIFIFFVNPARFPSLFTSFLCRRLYWTAGLRESLTSPPFPLTALPSLPSAVFSPLFLPRDDQTRCVQTLRGIKPASAGPLRPR